MKTVTLDTSAPGSFMAIPLESGGFGIVLITRRYNIKAIANIIYVYGFDGVYETIPLEVDVALLTISDAIHLTTVSDLFAREGRWRRIAQLPGFVESQWPVAPEAMADKGVYPADVSEQRIHIIGENEWCAANLPNDGLANAQEFTQLPPMKGLGDAKVLELALDRAIRKRHPLHYFRVSDEAVCIWNKVIERIKQRGLYPTKAPAPVRRGKRARKSK